MRRPGSVTSAQEGQGRCVEGPRLSGRGEENFFAFEPCIRVEPRRYLGACGRILVDRRRGAVRDPALEKGFATGDARFVR